jgi:hypothetical protein
VGSAGHPGIGARCADRFRAIGQTETNPVPIAIWPLPPLG